MVADVLAQRWEVGRPKRRFGGRVAQGRVGERGTPEVALLWPETYMNDAGRSVGPARGHFKLRLERVLVVHDDIDLPFGEVRTRLGGGLAGHNGLRSLKQELGGAGFWRVRMGVSRPPSTDPEVVAAYVLSRFSEPPAAVHALVLGGSEEVERVLRDETAPGRRTA
jgi:peptidyl-tRNA hydrolase, PTH1 family